MQTSTFYKILNEELLQIIDKNPTDIELNKHKNIEQNKGYAFLIWFLDFYGQNKLYKNYITEGKDDSSCDIIFSNKDFEDNDIYYVVQSKWINCKINEDGQLLRKNKPIKEYPILDKEEFNAVLTEFTAVANGSRQEGKNEKFNQKYQDLITHLEKNGKAKFIFFTAAEYSNEVNDTVKSFNREHAPNIELMTIDIEKIKRDYIEFRFKEIITNNPLEYNYHAEDENIEIEIERYKNGSSGKEYVAYRDILQFEGRMQAYIFSLRPKTIHQLFKKYKFNLFFKNVRNPLHRSNYNEKIVETLQRRPDTFWYFNNGVTAITKRIPDVGKNANTITIKGLQVINGAQTIYSVYQAYENASYEEREVMDIDARISFRLIRSSDEDFNLEITRYTNSQNAMLPRDFVANLEEQKRLQVESFKTNYWYEKRRDEFRIGKLNENLGIKIVPNELFTKTYVAFHLQRPVDSILNEDYFFIKRIEDSKGLYEEIFNAETKFEDMLSSFLVWKVLFFPFQNERKDGRGFEFNIPKFLSDGLTLALSISKIIFQKYLKGKYQTNNFDLNRFIIEDSEDNDEVMIRKILKYSQKLIVDILNKKEEVNRLDFFRKLMTNPTFYNVIKVDIEDITLSINDIEDIELKSSDDDSNDDIGELLEGLSEKGEEKITDSL
jgi:hypothetical protein